MRDRAWFAWVPRLGGSREKKLGAVFKATTRSKARYQCYMAAHDAGYDFITFADIHVVREPTLDDHSFKDGVAPRYL